MEKLTEKEYKERERLARELLEAFIASAYKAREI